MQKIYSLLRNNKQTGPYTIEDLLDLSLKPFDLIWVEGKSGGWSYPSEIEELKPHLIETLFTPNEFKESPSALQATKASTLTEPKAVDKTQHIHSSKHIHVSLPNGKFFKNIVEHNDRQIAFEEESPEAKLERKAQELRNKMQAFAEGKAVPKADNELDTKFSRSLDDIKEEYSDWLHHQKTKRVLPYKKMAIGAISLLFVLIIGYFVTSKLWTSRGFDDKEIGAQYTVTPVSYNEPSIKHNPKLNVRAKEQTPIKKPTKSIPIVKKQATSTDRIDDYIDSLTRAERKTIKSSDEVPVNEKIEDQQSMGTNPIANKKPDVDKTKISTESSESFTQQVRLSESTGDGAPKLTIYNNSNRFINFVAVDVSYYKANNKLLERKTLYFHNISANAASPLYVPELKKATSVKYQIGLISTDGGFFYANSNN